MLSVTFLSTEDLTTSMSFLLAYNDIVEPTDFACSRLSSFPGLQPNMLHREDTVSVILAHIRAVVLFPVCLLHRLYPVPGRWGGRAAGWVAADATDPAADAGGRCSAIALPGR